MEVFNCQHRVMCSRADISAMPVAMLPAAQRSAFKSIAFLRLIPSIGFFAQQLLQASAYKAIGINIEIENYKKDIFLDLVVHQTNTARL